MKHRDRFTNRKAAPADAGSGDLGIASHSTGVNEGHEVQARAPITVRLHRSYLGTTLGLFTTPVPFALWIVLLLLLPEEALTEFEPGIRALQVIVTCYGFIAFFYFWTKFRPARTKRIMVIRKRRIEFYWKDRSWERSVNGWIPWSRVQAVTAGSKESIIGHQIHVYLSTGPSSWASVQDSIPVPSEIVEEPLDPNLGELVSFPAVRLTIRYSPRAEGRSKHRSKAALSAPHESHTLPESQIRYALWAFRPDLCFGFEDLAETHPEEAR